MLIIFRELVGTCGTTSVCGARKCYFSSTITTTAECTVKYSHKINKFYLNSNTRHTQSKLSMYFIHVQQELIYLLLNKNPNYSLNEEEGYCSLSFLDSKFVFINRKQPNATGKGRTFINRGWSGGVRLWVCFCVPHFLLAFSKGTMKYPAFFFIFLFLSGRYDQSFEFLNPH